MVDLLVKTKVIIWDEAPMVNRLSFEALDRTLRDVLRFSNLRSTELPFRGKVVVLRDDFRQILPIIPKGTTADIVDASVSSSFLLEYCQVLCPTQNMRLMSCSSEEDVKDLKHFSDWILSVGDGTTLGYTDSDTVIEIPDELLIKDYEDPLAAIIESTYPNFQEKFKDSKYLQDRAILGPTLEVVEQINDFMLAMIPSGEHVYLSSDSVCKVDGSVEAHHDLITPELLISIRCSGMPNHVLKLKIGTPVC